jgi:hypothetical protein
VTDLLHDGAVGGFWTGVAAAATAAGYADEVVDDVTQAPGLTPTLSLSPILTLALTPTPTLTQTPNPPQGARAARESRGEQAARRDDDE